jgi:hypothetical protein
MYAERTFIWILTPLVALFFLIGPVGDDSRSEELPSATIIEETEASEVGKHTQHHPAAAVFSASSHDVMVNLMARECGTAPSSTDSRQLSVLRL